MENKKVNVNSVYSIMSRLLVGNKVDKKKIIEVESKASSYFDKIWSLTDIKITSLNRKRYEDLRKIFISIITVQCYEDNLLNNENIFTPRLEHEELFDASTITKVNNAIHSYAAPMVFLLRVLNPEIKKIESIAKNYKQKYLAKKQRADKMTGKKLSKEQKAKYLKILDKQKKLVEEYGIGKQRASLSNAIRLSDKSLTPKRIKSIAESIRYHQREGNLPK